MRYRACLLLLSLGLAACAHAPLPPPEPLFDDALFAAPTERLEADDPFALSDEMRHYVATRIASQIRIKGRQRALIDALYGRGELKLDYDAAVTRNAAQAFAARAGNCLSLVIMTAAFAKELGLPVKFQTAIVDETWSRSGNLYFRSGHVNLTLGKRLLDSHSIPDDAELMVDFLPPQELRGLRTRPIDEDTVVAMYLNNRAAESLARGRVDEAYWHAREAVRRSPGFLSAHNTLGVVYLRHRNELYAERVFRRVLEREPSHAQALSNLALVLVQQGRDAEAQEVQRRLAQVEAYPPFHFFNLGVEAMRAGDYKAARDWFAREVSRSGDYHEFHFWLGVAHYRLGEMALARKHLKLAMDNSTSRSDHALYAGKLARLRAPANTP
jgi:Flp pilus assembly protein TadD